MIQNGTPIPNRQRPFFSNKLCQIENEYYETLFYFAFHKEEIPTPDSTNINKTIAGERNVSKDIIDLCLREDGKAGLSEGVAKILEHLNDPEKAMEQLETLLWNDNSISSAKKTELCKYKSCLSQPEITL